MSFLMMMMTDAESQSTVEDILDEQTYRDTSLIRYDDPGAIRLFEYVGLFLLVALLFHQFCRHLITATGSNNVQQLQGLAVVEEELEILHQASKNASLHLFPPRHQGILAYIAAACYSFSNKSNNDNISAVSMDELQPLLYHIRSPPSNTSKENLHRKYHIDRLRVLGSAIWFRFQCYQGGFSKEDEIMPSLCKALTSKENKNVNAQIPCSTLGLPFMNNTLLWAILPQHRDLMSYCLDSLAWALYDVAASDVSFPGKIIDFPMDLFVIMLQEIIQQYYRIERQRPQEELVPDCSTPTDESPGISLEPLITEEKKDLDGTTICQYLQDLNVLMIFQDANLVKDRDKDESGYDPVQQLYCKLRPGILEAKADRTASTAPSWVQPYIKRLSMYLVDDNTSRQQQVVTHDHGKGKGNGNGNGLHLKKMILQHLPRLMIQLNSYSDAITILQNQQYFAISRLKFLGLNDSVSAFVTEWQYLQRCLESSCSPLPRQELNIQKSPVLDLVCIETLLVATEIAQPLFFLPPENKQDESPSYSTTCAHHRESVASACLLLSKFISSWLEPTDEDHEIAVAATQLLHYGRHLQLLVLESRCRHLAKTIHNLAITLHVRESILNKHNNKKGRKKKEKAKEPKETTTTISPSQACFNLATQVLEGLHEKCRKYHNKDNRSIVCCETTTIEELAIVLFKSLWRVWNDLQPILQQQTQKSTTTTTTTITTTDVTSDNNSNNDTDATDGVQYRINRIDRQFQKIKEATKIFAEIQSKLYSSSSVSSSNNNSTNTQVGALTREAEEEKTTTAPTTTTTTSTRSSTITKELLEVVERLIKSS